MKNNKGFTLIEILIVIAVIAILAVVVVLSINPSSLFKGQRDSSRVSSLTTITNAVAFAKANGLSLGTPGVAYVSVPDPTLTGNQTSTCSSLGLPTIASTTYQCVSAANLTNNNGTGWIPVAFNTLPGSTARRAADRPGQQHLKRRIFHLHHERFRLRDTGECGKRERHHE